MRRSLSRGHGLAGPVHRPAAIGICQYGLLRRQRREQTRHLFNIILNGADAEFELKHRAVPAGQCHPLANALRGAFGDGEIVVNRACLRTAQQVCHRTSLLLCGKIMPGGFQAKPDAAPGPAARAKVVGEVQQQIEGLADETRQKATLLGDLTHLNRLWNRGWEHNLAQSLKAGIGVDLVDSAIGAVLSHMRHGVGAVTHERAEIPDLNFADVHLPSV